MTSVAIHHLTDPTRPTVIPAHRFDPKLHRLWGATEEIIDEIDEEGHEEEPTEQDDRAPSADPGEVGEGDDVEDDDADA